ncbi:hypothetical protein ZWY2020_047791 [Hordeum vulgare]|nr:hypothetical protein ZWY2020_047791 [Hordeum vulgare]
MLRAARTSAFSSHRGFARVGSSDGSGRLAFVLAEPVTESQRTSRGGQERDGPPPAESNAAALPLRPPEPVGACPAELRHPLPRGPSADDLIGIRGER